MGNRVYLYCTSANEIPKEEERNEFQSCSGTEYETEYCIPLYWIIMFRESDIKILQGDRNGFVGDEREYPYLLCDRELCISRLKQYSDKILQGLGDIRHKTFLEWINRLEAENFKNIIVCTEELDWTYKEGAFEKDLRKVLNHIEVMFSKSDFKVSESVKDMCGIDAEDVFSENESYVLVGNANDGSNWPARYEPLPLPSLNDSPSKAWWKFW